MLKPWHIVLIAGLQLVTGCTSATPPVTEARITPGPTPATPATPAPTAALTADPSSPTPTTPTVDGVINADEYPFSTKAENVEVYWYNDGESLTIALIAPTTGWVAIGLDPIAGMDGADFLFAAATAEGPRFMDAYGKRGGGLPHQPDTALGGMDSILAAAVSESNEVTRAEIQIALNSGDAYDKALRPGDRVRFIVAYGRADDFSTKHQAYGKGELTLAP